MEKGEFGARLSKSLAEAGSSPLAPKAQFTMPSFETTVAEIRDSPQRGSIVILKSHELETTTNLKEVLLEPKFAMAGGKIHHDHIELFCDERPPIHEGQILMVRSLDPHGE